MSFLDILNLRTTKLKNGESVNLTDENVSYQHGLKDETRMYIIAIEEGNTENSRTLE